MELTHINITDLKISDTNVRKHGRASIAKSLDDLIPSIRSLGVLQPLLVRPNCEGYEIIAGQRRFHACTALATEDARFAELPCMIMDEGDDAKAIEASLAENVARLPMDEVDQYKAFAALVKAGQSVEDIASQFGVTERLVTQRLAIANLIGPVLTLYRKGEIGPDTVRIMTMATKAQQKKWLELWNGAERAPEGYRLKCWLFGGQQISTAAALFDVQDSGLAVIGDLFDDAQYFADSEAFWPLQNRAIAETRETLLAEGWADVTVLDVGEYFPSYDYVETAKEDGGKVYIAIAHDGAVTVYKGLLSRKDIRARDRAEASGEDKPTRPEITKTMQRHIDLHRHAAVRTELLSHSGIALRLAVAQMIAGCELWHVNAEAQKTPSDAVAESLNANAAEAAFAEEREAIRKLLGIEGENAATIVPRKDDWQVHRDLHGIFATLVTLSDEDVTRILTFVVAETLAAGTAMTDVLGMMTDTDMATHWPPDEAFFDLMRDKEAINAMLKEIGGKRVADGNATSTARVQKGVIRDYLSGTRKGGKQDWQPGYMAFPMQAYTKRGGIEAIDNWNAIKHHHA